MGKKYTEDFDDKMLTGIFRPGLDKVTNILQPASAGFLLGLHFDPEDGGDMFLRKVCCV
jgi:hypothetical protein